MHNIQRGFKIKTIGDRLLLFIIILNSISFLGNSIFKIYSRFGLYINFILTIVILAFYNRINKKEQNILMYLSFFTIYSLFTLFITNGGVGSVLIPLYSVLIIITFMKWKPNNLEIKTMLILFTIINLFWVFNSKDYYLKALYNKDKFINSNIIGMLLMYTFIYISIFLRKIKFKGNNILICIFFLISAWAILNCQSRGSFVTLVLFFILDNFIPKGFWKKKKRLLKMVILIIVMGVVFPYIYTTLYKTGINVSIPFTNKSLFTGREGIWNNFFINIKRSPVYLFFGLGSKVALWEGHNLNLHNNYLAIITNFGIIGFVLYYGFFIIQINKINTNKNISHYQVSLVLGFLCVLILGFLEVTTLWHIMLLFNFMFLGLARSNNNSESNICEKGI